MNKPHPEHICGFNDGEQNCECFAEGYEAGIQKAIEALETRMLKKANTAGMLKARQKQGDHKDDSELEDRERELRSLVVHIQLLNSLLKEKPTFTIPHCGHGGLDCKECGVLIDNKE